MKCKKIGCEKLAKYPFDCCSQLHGADVRWYKNDLRNIFDTNTQVSKHGDMLSMYRVEEALTYMQ